MGLFNRSTEKETSREYLRTSPLGQRKDILTFAALNAIVELPVSSAQANGRPVADTCGLDEARAAVRSVLHQDQSVYAWVARSAMVCLDALVETMEGTWDQNLDTAMNVMGLAPGPAIHSAARMALPAEVQENVLGLANYALSIFWVIAQPNAERDRTVYDHLFSSTAVATRETGYDITAWACILIGRLRNSGKLPDTPWFGPQFLRVPPLPEPGWYPNPYNRGDIRDGDATFQRFWNGDDWTDQIRNRDGRRWLEQMHSMHTPPNN